MWLPILIVSSKISDFKEVNIQVSLRMGDILHFLQNVKYGALIQRLFSASTIIKLKKPLKNEPPHTIIKLKINLQTEQPHTIELRMVFLWAHIMNYSPFLIVQIIDFFGIPP